MNECEDDELRRVRNLRGNTTEATDEMLSVGRARLERRIQTRTSGKDRVYDRAQRSRARQRTRGAAWVGASTIAIGAFIGIMLVVTPRPLSAPIPGNTSPADTHAAAAELLERAAQQVHFEDFTAGPGKLIRSDVYGEALLAPSPEPEFTDDGEMMSDPGVEPSPVVFRSESRWVSIQTGDVNTDRSAQLEDTIVELYGPSLYPVKLHFAPHAQPAGSLVGSGVSPFGEWQGVSVEALESGERLSAIDSTYIDGSGQEIAVPHFAPQRAASLPRNPEELTIHALAVIRDADVPRADEAAALFAWLTPLITFEQTPADLRATAYSALADLEGVVISDAEVTLAGRSGTGISFHSDSGLRTELVLDPETGYLVGSRTVLTQPNNLIPNVPVGTVVASSSVTYTVVDEMPCLSDLLGAAGQTNSDGLESGPDYWCGDTLPADPDA